MIPANRRKKQLFLVELWRETSTDPATNSWRGIVTHVAHAEERYIARLSDVTSFIAGCTDAAGEPDDDNSSSDSFRTPRC